MISNKKKKNILCKFQIQNEKFQKKKKNKFAVRLVNTVTNDVRFNSQKRHRAKEEEREGEMGGKKRFQKIPTFGGEGGGETYVNKF